VDSARFLCALCLEILFFPEALITLHRVCCRISLILRTERGQPRMVQPVTFNKIYRHQHQQRPNTITPVAACKATSKSEVSEIRPINNGPSAPTICVTNI